MSGKNVALMGCPVIWTSQAWVRTMHLNNTRQGYARKRTLKPAGFSFTGFGT